MINFSNIFKKNKLRNLEKFVIKNLDISKYYKFTNINKLNKKIFFFFKTKNLIF